MTPPPPLLDTSDMLLLGALALSGAYWLFGRSKDAGKPPGASSPGVIKSTLTVPGGGGAARPRTPDDRAIANKFLRDGKDIVVLYGSQTGTAEEFAHRLVKDGARYGLNCLAADPEDYDLTSLSQIPKNKLLIFVVATYGEGEPTDNAVAMAELLTSMCDEARDNAEDATPKPLANLHYAVFGLGNKTYEQFNVMAKNVDKMCTLLGATRVGPRGEGDDDANLEEDFISWRDEVWKEIAQFFNIDLAAAAQAAAAKGLARSFVHSEDIPEGAHVYKGELGDKRTAGANVIYDAKNPFYAPIVRTRDVFSGKEALRNCVHAEIDLAGSKLQYQPGDHLAMWPENEQQEVLRLAKGLGVHDKLDKAFTLTAADPAARKKHPFPCPTTYRAALTHYLDISVVPKPHVIQAWVPHIKDDKQRKWYADVAASKELYQREVVDTHATMADLLERHPISPPLPLDVALEGFGRIQPRYYSISSSPRYTPNGGSNMVHITATVLRYKSSDGRKLVHGLATRHLWDAHTKLQNGQQAKIPVAIRHAAFKLPRQNATPVIMIGPGTGVAPMRGFVQERCAIVAKQQQSGAPTAAPAMGESLLFFGCRYQAHDFLYADEWPRYIKEGGLSELVTAFSRDTAQKVYVQHRLAEHQQQVWDLVKKGAHVYVCGDAKNMARDVQKWFIETAQALGGMTEDKAARFVKDMRNRGRYLEDVWS